MPFRLATESDFPRLLAMQRAFYEHEGYPFDVAIAEQSMRQLVSEPRFGRLWVIEHDGAVAGYMAVTFGFSLEFRGRDAFIDELFIDEAARGQGLGAAAVRVAEHTCIEAGIRTLHLEVEHENEHAKRIYLRKGFHDHSRHLMSKHLAPRVIETERLRFRPATADDVDLLHRIWTDREVRRYLWDGRTIERETAAGVVEASLADWRERGYGLWVVEEEGHPIGFAGFRSSDEDPRQELMFGFLPSHWHRGLATEAAKAAIEFAFESLRCEEIRGATDPPNEASVRVMERAGMTFERRGTLNGLDTLFFATRRET
ncbi:MAG TPA: GNAT family N-acetyltransferase [Thermoanaerobaculia bacterium]|nr:GNAT family N-acetyltransferase [Thermoanaerobaculia bacterium]